MFSYEELHKALVERHGAELQKKFDSAQVAVCGLGGLGSNIAVSLIRAGVGKLLLIDFDRVDVSNLNRQQYFCSQIGMYKTEALMQTLKKISPFCEITAKTIRLTEENIPPLLADMPIICEAFDNAEQKAMLVNTVLTQLPKAYIIASSGMAGLGSPNAVHTRRITKHFYLCGDEHSDVSEGLGLVSARVAVCASHQATTVLRIIAGEYDT